MKRFGLALVAILAIGFSMASATPAQAGVNVIVRPGGGYVGVGPVGIQWGPSYSPYYRPYNYNPYYRPYNYNPYYRPYNYNPYYRPYPHYYPHYPYRRY